MNGLRITSPSSSFYNAGPYSNYSKNTIYSVLSISSSCVTSSDIIGPGRTIGRFYSKLGKALENSLSRYSERNGNGPKAVSQKIEQAVENLSSSVDPQQGINKAFNVKKIQDELTASCKKLLRYVRSNIPVNQLDTIHAIILLSVTYPILQDFFQKCFYSAALQKFLDGLKTASYTTASTDEFNQLITSTRYALVSISDNEINVAAKQLSHSVDTSSLVLDSGAPFAILMESAYGDSEESHIARMHLNNWLRRLSGHWQVDSIRSTCDTDGKVISVMCNEMIRGITKYDEAGLNRIVRVVHGLVSFLIDFVDSTALDAIICIVLRFHEVCPAVDREWDFGIFLDVLLSETVAGILPQSSKLASRFFILPQGIGPEIRITNTEKTPQLSSPPPLFQMPDRITNSSGRGLLTVPDIKRGPLIFVTSEDSDDDESDRPDEWLGNAGQGLESRRLSVVRPGMHITHNLYSQYGSLAGTRSSDGLLSIPIKNLDYEEELFDDANSDTEEMDTGEPDKLDIISFLPTKDIPAELRSSNSPTIPLITISSYD